MAHGLVSGIVERPPHIALRGDPRAGLLLRPIRGLAGLAPWGETNSLDTVDRSLVFDGQQRLFAA